MGGRGGDRLLTPQTNIKGAACVEAADAESFFSGFPADDRGEPTLGRLFSDIEAKLARIEAALADPSCEVDLDVMSADLAERCHADAFVEVALAARVCMFHVSTAGNIKIGSCEQQLLDELNLSEEARYEAQQIRRLRLRRVWLDSRCAGNRTLRLSMPRPETHVRRAARHIDRTRRRDTCPAGRHCSA